MKYPVKDKPAALQSGPSGALALCLSLLWAGQPAQADGEFAQFDASQSTAVGTLSVERGALSFGASAVAYDGGEIYGLSATYKLPFAQDVATLRIGPSVGLIRKDDTDAQTEAGLKLVAERYTTTDFGGVFFLADINTINRSWFLLSQVSFAAPGLSVEVSTGESDSYPETSLAIAKRLPDTAASLRAGYKFDSEELFAGVSFNTF